MFSLENAPLLLTLGWLTLFSVIALLRRPDAATWLFALLLYTNTAVVLKNVHSFPAALAAGLGGLLLIPVAYHVLVRGEPILLGPAPLWLFGFFAVQIAGALGARFRDVALSRIAVNLAEGLLLYFLVLNAIRSRTSLQRTVWAMLLAGSFMGGLGLFQAATKTYTNNYGGFAQVPEYSLADHLGESDYPQKPRAAGPIGEKNYYAQFMLMLAPLAFFQIRSESRLLPRCAALGALLLILAGVALSGSRGAAVGFVAVLVVLACWRYVSFTQLGVLAVAAALVIALVPSYRERLSTLSRLWEVAQGRASIQDADRAVQGRATEMVAATQVFLDHPLVGVGPGNFPEYFVTRADTLGFQVHAGARLAHCMYLEIAAENGVLGLGCFLAVCVSTAIGLTRVRQQSRTESLRELATGLLLALVVLATTGLFLSFAYARYYWLILALAASAVVLGESMEPAEEDASSAALGSLPYASTSSG